MNLYKLTNPTIRWDIFTAAIVAAESEHEARRIHPSGTAIFWKEDDGWYIQQSEAKFPVVKYTHYDWVDHPDELSVQLIGMATPFTKQGVILSDFAAAA